MKVNYFIRTNGSAGRIYFRYRPHREVDIVLSTPFLIDKNKWDNVNECHNRSLLIRNPKNALERNNNDYIVEFNLKLQEFKIDLEKYIISKNYKVDSPTIRKFIDQKHRLKKPKPVKESLIPLLFSDFVDYYIKQRSENHTLDQKPINKSTVAKYNVIKNRVIEMKPNIKITDIDDNFKRNFTTKLGASNYKTNTIIKALKHIKTFVSYAKLKKIQVNPEVDGWSFNFEKKEYHEPTLSLNELQLISDVHFEHNYLDNARDWLILGCYCGQRVSDFLQFDTEKIVEDNFIEFTQKKGDKKIAIIMLPKVKIILEKYNRSFPRKISDQKFNDYIKLVCKEAGLNEKISGVKMINKRKINGVYEKWELVTSHICRRSFVTNFRERLGDEIIMYMTGHTSKKMLDLYDQITHLVKGKAV